MAAEPGGRKDLRGAAAAPETPCPSPECRALAKAAAPASKKPADLTLSAALLESPLSALEAHAGVPLVARDAKGDAAGLTLTGWSAVAGMAALAITLLAAAAMALRSYFGLDSTARVLKARGPSYKRVGAS